MDQPSSPTNLDDSCACEGGSIPDGQGPAYRLWTNRRFQIPVLIAVPHGGRNYPAALIAQLREPDSTLPRLEDRHVDTLACAIAQQTQASLLVAHAPRAMIDLNRSPDDIDWSMVNGAKPARSRHSLANRRARGGLGLVPRRLSGSGEIWRELLRREDIDTRLECVHRPYHRVLGRTMEQLRDHWGAALLVDLHSMPPLKTPRPDERAADFVIGDRYGAACDHRLTAAALAYLARSGRAVAHNRPYSGGYVLDRHAAPNRGLHALQIEVCRSTYLDARLDLPSARLAAVARLLAGLIDHLADRVIALGDGGQALEAAE